MINYDSPTAAATNILKMPLHVIWHATGYSKVKFIIPLVVGLVIGLLPLHASAQTATIIGEIRDAATGEPIEGITVNVEEFDRQSISDGDGRYAIQRIPAGDHILIFDAIGYESQNISLNVNEGQSKTHDVELNPVTDQDEEGIPIDPHQRQTEFLLRQLQSGTVQASVTYEQMESFSDYTVDDALRRLPGVQSTRRGEVNLRGAGLNRYNATVDGQRLSTTGMGDRTIELGSFSTDLVRDVEFIKVLTPDMDADALGGVVNLRTYRPLIEERQLDVLVGGGSNSHYYEHTGLNSRIAVRYDENPLEDLFLSVNLNHNRENYAWESVGISHGTADFGEGPVDVIESISPGLHTNDRDRFGGSLQLTYQPSERERYFVRGIMSTDTRQEVRQRNIFSANGDWVDPTTTGTQANFSNNLELQDIDYQHYLVQAGGRHMFNILNLEYSLGWAQSSVRSDYYAFPFQDGGYNFNVNSNDRKRPVMEFIDDQPRLQDMSLQRIDYIIDDHLDNKVNGNIDIEIPYNRGAIEFGASAVSRTKDANEDGAYSEYLYSSGGLAQNQFDGNKPTSTDLFDESYSLPWLLDADAARSYFHSSIPNLSIDQGTFHRNSDIWNYKASEDIYSGYGMGSFETGMFTLKAGARLEHTEAEYDGRSVRFNRFNLYESTTDTTDSHSYTNIFPNAQVLMQPDDQTNVRLAYSRSMKRPNFNQLAPFELINAQDTTIFRGNPEIEPLISDNLDLHAEHYFEGDGMVSIGLFYKELSNFVTQTERTVEVNEGENAFLDNELFTGDETSVPVYETLFDNSDEEASLYGVELAFQHNLRFLPGFLNNFGIYANYTWTDSNYEPESREDEIALPYQSPHVVNVALDYIQGRFSTKIAYHRTAEYLSNFSADQSRAPSINPDDEVFLDQFEDGWTDLTATVRFRITENFRVWADAFNLLAGDRVQYNSSRGDYPTNIDNRRGRGFQMGLHFSL